MVTAVGLIVAGALVVSGCGSDGGGGDDNDAAEDAPSTDEDQPADGGGEGRGNERDECPLTAEQVGEVLGVEVTDEAGCIFYPADGALTPNANYVEQVDFACGEEYRSEAGYTESVEGVGADAYVQQGTAIGTLLLVCGEGSPFEITVDSDDEAAEEPAAVDLAKLVLSV